MRITLGTTLSLSLVAAAAWIGCSSPEPPAPGSATPAATSESNVRPDGRQAAKQSPPVDSSPVACEHPLVPTRVGAWQRYRQTRAAMTLGKRVIPAALTTLEYHVTGLVRAADHVEVVFSSEVKRGERSIDKREFRRSCWKGVAAEDPWFEPMGLESLDQEHTRLWRWPHGLSKGNRFDGSFSLSSRGADGVSRTANGAVKLEVKSQELVEVPAGKFRATRTDFTIESAGGGGLQNTGRLWIAEHVGMIKMTLETESGPSVEKVLEAFGPQRQD